MNDMQVTFRRLDDATLARFRPWYQASALKIGWIFLLAIVGWKWVVR